MNNRIILIKTPSKNHPQYIKAVKKYNNNKKRFYKRYTVLKYKISNKFKIILIGFDGTVKKKYSKFSTSKIIQDIESMPMGQYYRS